MTEYVNDLLSVAINSDKSHPFCCAWETAAGRQRNKQTTIFAEKGKIIVEMIGFLINICNFASEIEILLTK